VKLIALTLLEDAALDRGEQRDALDQRWTALLRRCGAHPLLLPNDSAVARDLLEVLPVAGALLTGGGTARRDWASPSSRDLVERELLAWSLARKKPLLGVCRGMQALLAWEGVMPRCLKGHVRTRHTLDGDDGRIVNSYHDYGFVGDLPPYDVRARAPDGSIEWIEDRERRRMGIMWHPEREDAFADADIRLIADWFAPLD
jgi:N5-(cytidine 5'-diphosphoramidyl)-L-glutamine hydrolase